MKWNCFAVYLFMSDDVILLDITKAGKVGRFIRYLLE